ncbi:MAG: LemA family protein [Armatimonadota bacterium]
MTYPQQDPTNLITLALFLAPPLLLLIWVIATFNRLVNLRNLIDESWSNVGTELKRRYELIPNLVETVKGYAAHEKEIFQSIADARARALATVASVTSDSAGTQAASENQLTRGIQQLLAVSEAYTDLKANNNFIQL